MTTNAQARPTGGLAARLALLRSPVVRVAFLIAPAGYGKTTTANTLRKEYGHSGICDCDAAGLAQFSRNVLGALADENPAEAAFYSGLQAQLAAVVDNENECKNLLNAAWSKDAPPSLFTFENAEVIAPDPLVMSAFIALLNTAPPNRRILVCSRTPLPARASRYLPPHRISTLSTKHFTFGDAEAIEMLGQQGVESRYWERIVNLARGWPVVLLLLARLAREDRLDAALNDARHVAFEDLFVYLLHEVLAPLETSVKLLMTLCSAVPDLTLEEIAIATETTELQAEALLRKALLVERNQNGFTVHPLLREVLLQTQGDVYPFLFRIAASAKSNGNYRRAATLYRLAGQHDAAADCLVPLSFEQLETSETVYELLQLWLPSLLRHPKLIAACAPHRSDITADILRDVFEHLTEANDPEAIVAVAEMYTYRLPEAAQALRVINSPIVQRAGTISRNAAILLEGWPETLGAHFNAFKEFPNITERLCSAYGVLVDAHLPFRSARVAAALATISRWNGQREESLHWTAIAVAHARASGPRVHSEWLFYAIYNAWLWGDETSFTQFYEELELAAATTRHPDYAWRLRALQPETLDSALPLLDKSTTVAALLMAASKTEMPARLQLFDRADQVVETMGLPSNITLLARAASDPNLRSELCAREAAMPHLAEMTERRKALLAYGQGRPSYLDSYTAHFEPKAYAGVQRSARMATLRLKVLNEQLIVGTEAIRLTAREAALLALLSRRRTATPREEIQDAIWPDLDELKARDALYSLLHRLRKRIHGADVVESAGNAYRLSDTVQVDLWDLEFIAQKVQRGAAINPGEDVRELCNAVQHRAYSHLRDYDWFAPMEFRIREHARVLARHLIDAARAQGDDATVIRYAKDLLDEEPCDEWAHETLIRLHLERANRTEAARAYRNYRQLLEQQLGTPPSTEMQQLAERLNA